MKLLIGLLILLQTSGYFPFTRPPQPGEERPPNVIDDGFVFCRLVYPSDRLEPDGRGWSTDFPSADRNFMTRLGDLTTTRLSHRFGNDVNVKFDHWVVEVDSPDLFLCPFLVTSDVGTMNLSEQEAWNLRQYLLKGGFLWVDDFWGSQAWDQWLRELRKMFPARPVLIPDFDHPLYNMFYKITETLQVSNVSRWLGGVIQERGEDSPETPLKIVVDDYNRAMIVMTHNTDVSDTWEEEGTNAEYMLTFSPDGYALGINVLLYAMSH